MDNEIPSLRNLALRSKIIRGIREWFYENGYIEVDTPVRIAAPAPEPNIDCPKSGRGWLRASPELQMKRILARGAEKIFQIGPCFRQGECGKRHNPEFSMLEWYRVGASSDDILSETISLLRFVASYALGTQIITKDTYSIDLNAKWEIVSVRDAYLKWAGWDPVTSFEQDRFDEDMALKIEPKLPKEKPFVLCDYPKAAASLARLRTENPLVAERWELYIGGIEIANAYGELTNGTEQRRRFEKAKEERRRLDEDDYPLDEDFLNDLEEGKFPSCGGIALGIDRLVMLLCNEDNIASVRPFSQRPGEIL